MIKFTFISGATGGLGKAFALSCAKKGQNLFLTGRSAEKLEKLKEEIKAKYAVEIKACACDLTDSADRQKMLDFIDSNEVTFDKIINVAGVDIQKAFEEYTSQKVLFQIRVNVEATICLTHSLMKRRAEELQILTISSMSGASPMPYFALYSATKASLINFFTSLHYELKRKSTKVTVVMPGGIPTRPDIIEDIKGQGVWGKLSSKSPEYVAEKSLKALSKNKVKYIPGGFNKFLYVLMKFVPSPIKLRFIAKRWSKQTKDAF